MEQSPVNAGTPTQPSGWRGRIVRWRWAIFALVVVLHALAFNGQWRIGRDSALYRGLGNAMAGGSRLVTPAQADGLVLPGYPLMLAGMQRFFGDRMFDPWPQLLVMEAMAALTLVVVYRLLLLRIPRWMAVLATAALGVNWKFVQQANELMTDMPFLLGVCTALLGYELLVRARPNGGYGPASAVALIGLMLAASMRPTFVALAGAWGLACVWQLACGRDRKANAIGLGLLGIVCIAMMVMIAAMPSRAQVQKRAQRSWTTAVARVKTMLGDSRDDERPDRKTPPWHRMMAHHLPEAVFGIELWYFSALVSIALLGYGLWLGRVNPLWALLILGSAGMFALVGTVPRYFLMVMPLLIVAWLRAADLIGQWLARRTARQYHAAGLVMLGAAGLLIVPSVGKSMGIVFEQHGILLGSKAKTTGAEPIVSFLPISRSDFAHTYRDGKFIPIVAMARQIAATVPPGQAVLGPEPRIMTYVSGRRVLVIGDSNRQNIGRVPFLRRYNVKWAVWPAEVYSPERIAGHPHSSIYPDAGTFQTLGDPAYVVLPGVKKKAPMTLLPLELKEKKKHPSTKPATRKASLKIKRLTPSKAPATAKAWLKKKPATTRVDAPPPLR